MHVFIPGRSVAQMACIFYFLLVSMDLLRVGQQGRYSSSLFPANNGTVGFSSLLFCFIMCISTHWLFGVISFSAVSDLENCLRDLFRSWGYFSFFCLTFYGGGSEVVGKFSDRASNAFRKGGSLDVIKLAGCILEIWYSLYLMISFGCLWSCRRVDWSYEWLSGSVIKGNA